MNLPDKYFKDFVSLFFPNVCLVCQSSLPLRDEPLCLSCQLKLPKTEFHQSPENDFTDRFYGRIPLRFGAAYYYFYQGSRTQELMFQFKYKDKKELGNIIGKEYGKKLIQSPHFPNINLIVPVPLHPKKQYQRGYNQSEYFAKGLSESLGVPVATNILSRKEFTRSQTRKNRLERIENVNTAFQVHRPEQLKGQHILLVDDVLTTGATLEACALNLLEAEGVNISMVTIAMATM